MSVFSLHEYLPANTPEETYISLPALQASISTHYARVTKTTRNLQDEFIIFTSVPSSIITTLSTSPHILQDAVLWASNTASSRIILKLQSPLLGVAKTVFVASLKAKLDKMGVLSDLVSLGAKSIKTGASGKAPDAAFRPRDKSGSSETARPDRDADMDPDWPSIILEVGFLETGPPALRASARWWLENSSGEVGVVVLLFVHAAQPRVCVETWEFRPPGPLACKVQEVIVEKRENGRTGEKREKGVAVIGAPMKIPVQKVLPKKAVNGGENIVFDEEDVRSLARDVWIQQGYWEIEAKET
ncbi:hypothetical protein PMAA_067590 [Paecilomyces variotii No. 5]|uniref:Uncharacterized protein n=1 Tax=Byssochlamys spectabilis (strain No. 5 / NBRC 109023) TaxID=1356009 RepID=V5HTE1_BYSSN|nr:hypothetical protein PMAA_067590 [Paecilomyces variotii No. 5]